MSGASNAQKTPFGQSMNTFARKKAVDQIQQLGRSLPCTVVKVMGSIVQVNFEINAPGQTIPNVTIPIIGSEYIRLPIQSGCKGLTIAADAYLGGMSGIGGGVAGLAQPMNLTALAFVPLGNTAFTSVDPSTLTLYGEPGILLKTKPNDASVALTPSSVAISSNNTVTASASTSLTLSAGGHSVVINSAGVTIDGILWDTHTHLYSPGGGTPTDTGPPL